MDNKKRIFICSRERFPRGSAGANYLQYLALALKDKNWSVIVIGRGDNRECDYDQTRQIYEYRGIEYYNINVSEKSLRQSLSVKYFYGRYFKEAIEHYGFNKEDYAIFLTISVSMMHKVKKYIPSEHLSVCVVEWYQPSQYRLNIFSPSYILCKYYYKYISKKIGRIMPISTVLEKYFKSKACKTLLLPAMADPDEYSELAKKISSDKLKFIYSGNKYTNKEDTLEPIFRALLSLNKGMRDKVEFHITGIKKDNILNFINGDTKLLADLEGVLIIHDWLEYKDLVNLYSSMHFLVLARNDNKITRANFPSKVPELLCYGVIPICTDVGDYTRYYLKDGYNSIILQGSTVTECKRGIVRAIKMNSGELEKMRDNCRNTAYERFYYKIWSDKITGFLTGQYAEVN